MHSCMHACMHACIQIQTYTSYEPIDLPTHIFCMEVRIEKSKDMMVTNRRGENTPQEIRVDGKMMDEMNNFHQLAPTE